MRFPGVPRYQDGQAVTPSDTARLPSVASGFYVGGTGDVKVVTPSRNFVTFTNLPAGALIPIEFTHVMDTDTDATGIVALYGHALLDGTFTETAPASTFDTEITQAGGDPLLTANNEPIIAAAY